MTKLTSPPARLAWTIWGLGAIFYLIGFYQRVAPAVMTTELMNAFQINAATLGNLSAFYFYSYVAMQVPTGVLADTWGPRRLLAGGALVCGAGTLLFALAPNILWADVGRLLIGGSAAVAFVGMLKLAGHWFAPRQYALSAGLALFVGVVGAVLAGVPLQLLVAQFGWRAVMLVSAVLPLLTGAAIWWLVRDDPSEKGYTSYAHLPAASAQSTQPGFLAGLGQIFRYRNAWLLCLIPGGIVGPVLTFSGLWGVSFLTSTYGLTATQAAAVNTTLLVTWAVGGPIFGALSDRIGRRKPLYVGGCAVVVLGWTLVILTPQMPVWLLVVLLAITGFASGCMVVGFAFMRESVPLYLAGTATGLANMGVMMGPMLLQPAVSWMLDQRWQGEMLDGARLYSLEAYQAGFSLMLVWAGLALLLILFTQETYCRQLLLPETPGHEAVEVIKST
ncbi:MAG: MFS transporter [Anaerolineales bacterium]|nr:MFS transporter [Anaerolineales bacterium]